MNQPLYDNPRIYDLVFPCEREEIEFFASLAGGAVSILDAAAGTGGMADAFSRIGHAGVVSIDRDRNILAGGLGLRIVCDLAKMAIGDSAFDFVYSRLFGYAYAMATAVENSKRLVDELARVLNHSGSFALELPVAHDHATLQGLSESAFFSDNLRYTFQYWDIIRRTSFGTVFQSTITVRNQRENYVVEDAIHVFHPDGVCAWLASANLMVRSFYAPYDLESKVVIPPADCLRAIVTGAKAGHQGIGGGGAALPSTV